MKAAAATGWRRIGLGAAVVVFAAAAALAGEEKQPAKAKIGETAPNFTLTDSSGTKRSLSDYEGKLVVLEWINTECPVVARCYKEGVMQKAYQEVMKLDKGAVWLAVNTTWSTTPEKNNFWIKQHDLKYPVLLDTDGQVGHMYGAMRTPHMFVIDKEGVLRYEGAIDNKYQKKAPDDADLIYVVSAVQQIVDGETVAPDRVKPYGCSVKYKR